MDGNFQMTAGDTPFVRKFLGWCPNAPAAIRKNHAMAGAGGEPGMYRERPPAGGITGWIGHNGHAAVAITTALCLLALAAVLKNILLVPPDTLNRDMVLYIILYGGYITSFTPVKGQACPERPERWPLFWCAVSVAMTIAIIIVYAL